MDATFQVMTATRSANRLDVFCCPNREAQDRLFDELEPHATEIHRSFRPVTNDQTEKGFAASRYPGYQIEFHNA